MESIRVNYSLDRKSARVHRNLCVHPSQYSNRTFPEESRWRGCDPEPLTAGWPPLTPAPGEASHNTDPAILLRGSPVIRSSSELPPAIAHYPTQPECQAQDPHQVPGLCTHFSLFLEVYPVSAELWLTLQNFSLKLFLRKMSIPYPVAFPFSLLTHASSLLNMTLLRARIMS